MGGDHTSSQDLQKFKREYLVVILEREYLRALADSMLLFRFPPPPKSLYTWAQTHTKGEKVENIPINLSFLTKLLVDIWKVNVGKLEVGIK